MNKITFNNTPQHVCDNQVFDDLFRKCAAGLRNYIYYKSGDLAMSEDVLQTAFFKLWENCKKVKPTTAKSYLYTVAKNLFTNYAIREKKKINLIKKLQPSYASQETPQYLIEYEEYKYRLEEAINQLPDKQKEVFLLNRIDKLTYREIAENLGISVKAVEKRMHKAIYKLKTILDH